MERHDALGLSVLGEIKCISGQPCCDSVNSFLDFGSFFRNVLESEDNGAKEVCMFLIIINGTLYKFINCYYYLLILLH
jgi:hypothetical protein